MNNVVRPLLLVILTLAAFHSVLYCEFIAYDDPLYVTGCAFVRQGLSWDNAWWALTTFEASNWHPLTWWSLMLDRSLYGLNPAGFHATNLLWHVVNTLLLFQLVLRIAPNWPWRAFLVALLFAVHPLHVESVAWVAERKDLLFTAFGLLSLHSYVSYARGSKRAYWWSILFFVFSLMSKSMLLTFPFLLLLLDFWPLCRVVGSRQVCSESELVHSEESEPARTLMRTWPQLVWEKWPMFLVIFGVAAAALLAQSKGGTVSSWQVISPSIRIANAALAYGLYLWDTIWPAGLSVIYRHPQDKISYTEAGIAFVFLLATSLVLYRFRRPAPAAWVGWCWFLGTLMPVIGLVQVGVQQRADRYTYFPLIGLFWGAVWTVGELLARRKRWRTMTAIATSLLMACLLFLTHAQVEHWRNTRTLFEHAREVEPQNAIAYHNIGIACEKEGDTEAAIEHYRKAVEIEPTLLTAQTSLAYALMGSAEGSNQVARRKEAVAITKNILKADPKHALACNLKGNALREAKRYEEAVTSLQTAVESLPHSATIRSNLAITLYEMGRRDEAQKHFDEARRLDSANPTLLLNLGVVEFQTGNVRKAIELFEQSARAAPEDRRPKRFQASAHLTLGALAMQQGKYSDAIGEFEKSDELEPRVWQLQVNFGEAYLQLNQLRMAENRYQTALQVNPECSEAHFGLGRVYANLEKFDLAITHLDAALAIKPDFQPAQELLKTLKGLRNEARP